MSDDGFKGTCAFFMTHLKEQYYFKYSYSSLLEYSKSMEVNIQYFNLKISTRKCNY